MGACRRAKAECEIAEVEGTCRPAGTHTHLVKLGPGHVLLVVGEDRVSPALQYCLGSPAPGVWGWAQIAQR